MELDNTDKVFEKKLASFSEEPHERVWSRIEKSLKAKERKRIVPIWLSLSGAAAVLLIGFLLSNPIGQSSELKVSKSDVALPQTSDGKQKYSPEKTDEFPAINGSNSIGPISQTQSSPNVVLEKSSKKMKENRSVSNYPSDNASKNLEIMPPAEEVSALDEGTFGLSKESSNPEEISPYTGFASALPAANMENEIPEALALEKTGKWTLGTNIAPVYYGHYGNGSPIAPAFMTNSKSGLVNMSYGLSVTYALNSRLSFRSGINKIDLGYQTNDIAFTSDFVSRSSSLIRTINYSENSKNIVVHSTSSSPSTAETNNNLSDLLAPSPEREGQMVQQFGYVEVPLELQYTLVNKKWGLNFIGGMSSLFLVNNSISLNSSGSTLDIGEAANMNSMLFSTNVGIGGSYPLRKDLLFNLQPMFKLHLNAFSETSGQFRPYTLGIYSGLSFKF